MFRFKTAFMVLALGLVAPICAYAANFCVAVNGGFGRGGTSYIAPAFTLPAKNNCAAWSGFTKTATTVIAISTGTGLPCQRWQSAHAQHFQYRPGVFRRGRGRLGSNPVVSERSHGLPDYWPRPR